MPEKKTLIRWRDAVPGDFVFSVKASRYLTHMIKEGLDVYCYFDNDEAGFPVQDALSLQQMMTEGETMPIQNSDVADIFEKDADFLELEGENPFRVSAHGDAARTMGGNSRSGAEIVEDEDLTSLSGIGEDPTGKIREIVETGSWVCVQ